MKKKMNITILSDLNWESHLRSITLREVEGFEKSDLALSRYDSLRRYYDVITDEESDIVLFAGDVTGDGSCGRGFHYAFVLLLKLLEIDQISSAYISGNHDEEGYYGLVNKFIADFTYTQEISNKIALINGLKIMGLNYYQSKSKRQLNSIISEANESYDIVIAHSQLKRRVRLFEIETDYIFTGHYDRKLLYHDESVYVSLDNDASEISYAVIEQSHDGSDTISIKIKESDDVTISLDEKVNSLRKGVRTNKLSINGIPTIEIRPIEMATLTELTKGSRDYSYLKFIRGIHYIQSMTTMQKLKAKEKLGKSDLLLQDVLQLQIVNNYKISESMIEDYLGNVL